MFIPDRTRPLVEQVKQGTGFGTNHTDSTTTGITYVGMEDSEGVWVVQKIDSTTPNTSVMTYASVKNNSNTSTYSSAWTNRASLSYGLYSEAF